MDRFENRTDAGVRLAEQVRELDLVDPLVLALPRGGVPVAFEVAQVLSAPLDVFVARKIGAPGHREFGVGAIAEGGGLVADQEVLDAIGVDPTTFDRLVAEERVELDRRVRAYRGDRELPDLRGHDVVLVDDGLATGVTAEAAIDALGRLGARRIVLAVPTCAPDSADRLRRLVDTAVCLIEPAGFAAVGQWYERFDQTTDAEVEELLRAAR